MKATSRVHYTEKITILSEKNTKYKMTKSFANLLSKHAGFNNLPQIVRRLFSQFCMPDNKPN